MAPTLGGCAVSLRVFIGWDSREQDAFDVAEGSMRAAASGPLDIVPLKLGKLEQQGLLRRPRWRRPGSEVWFDTISDAPMSTEFAISRFAVPLLAQCGFALFTDCDIVAYGDVYELEAIVRTNPDLALWCVQHRHDFGERVKMDGQPQTYYARKNWSSVMAWNCDHPVNTHLTLEVLNTWPGRRLHGFEWLHDSQIGNLPHQWNWLVGVTPRPPEPKIAHYTLGGPWLPNWKGGEHDSEYLAARARFWTKRVPDDPRPSQETMRN